MTKKRDYILKQFVISHCLLCDCLLSRYRLERDISKDTLTTKQAQNAQHHREAQK
jgi:hypothetical protein